MKTSINFRTTKPQTVNLPWSGESVITFVGTCPISGESLYECSTGNDPRGPLGRHAVHDFVASEYNMVGPDVSVSWIAVNDDRSAYEQGLSFAMSKWSNP